MSYIEIILLSFIQGITEFFPVSSSGHLLISKIFLSIENKDILIDVVLHLGTLFAIIFFWRKDLLNDLNKIYNGNFNLIVKIIVGCIPVGLIGLFFSDIIEDCFFANNNKIPLFLIVNYLIMAILIFVTKFFKNNFNINISYLHALLIGFFQCFALMPGISRSGVTIVAALFLGYTFSKSMKFSFYLAIPTIFFGSLMKISNIETYDSFLILLTGLLFSFIFGYLVLLYLDKIIQKQKYWLFSIYCLLLSIILLVYNYGI